MLSKKNRLNKQQYNKVFKLGKTVNTPLFMMKYIKNPKNKRFSVVVPKKVIKEAYKRNALRRFIYNLIREHFDSIDDGEYILILKKTYNSESQEKLKDIVLEYLKKNS